MQLRGNGDPKTGNFARKHGATPDSLSYVLGEGTRNAVFFEEEATAAVVVKNAGQLTLICRLKYLERFAVKA
jgi:hypothetical protein